MHKTNMGILVVGLLAMLGIMILSLVFMSNMPGLQTIDRLKTEQNLRTVKLSKQRIKEGLVYKIVFTTDFPLSSEQRSSKMDAVGSYVWNNYSGMQRPFKVKVIYEIETEGGCSHYVNQEEKEVPEPKKQYLRKTQREKQ